jgi:hypothetical protein
MCYLSSKYSCARHWCPPASDLTARAAFDSALSWYHTTIRVGNMQLVFNKVLGEQGASYKPYLPHIFNQNLSCMCKVCHSLRSVGKRGVGGSTRKMGFGWKAGMLLVVCAAQCVLGAVKIVELSGLAPNVPLVLLHTD